MNMQTITFEHIKPKLWLSDFSIEIYTDQAGKHRVCANLPHRFRQAMLDELMYLAIVDSHHATTKFERYLDLLSTSRKLGGMAGLKLKNSLPSANVVNQTRLITKTVLHSAGVLFTTASCNRSTQLILQNCPLLQITNEYGGRYSRMQELVFAEFMKSVVRTIDHEAQVTVHINTEDECGSVRIFHEPKKEVAHV